MASGDALTLTSPEWESEAVQVPLGCEHVQLVLDGSWWPPEVRATLWVDIDEGQGRRRHGQIGTETAALVGGHCSVGWIRQAGDGNRNPDLRLWFGVQMDRAALTSARVMVHG